MKFLSKFKKVNLFLSWDHPVAVKSTLLNLLGMLDSPERGKYQFNDTQISGLNEKQRSEIRKKHIGFRVSKFQFD